MCPTGTSLIAVNAGGSTPEFRRAFDVIDADRDGKISGDDLRSFYTSLAGAGAGDEEHMVTSMITAADANKDGYVQYDEFERVLKERKCGRNNGENEIIGKEEKCYGDRGVMGDVFRVMDQDGDGRLGLEDLMSYMGRVGLPVGEEDIKAMIRLGGGDERQGVSFDEFVNIFAVHDIVG